MKNLNFYSKQTQFAAILLGLALISGCNQAPYSAISGTPNTANQATKNFSLKLTSTGSSQLTSAFINISRAELLLIKGTDRVRLKLALGTGIIDLQTLSSGALIRLDQVNIPKDYLISELRLIIAATDNSATKIDGTRCGLRTPGGQDSSIRVSLQNSVLMEPDFDYTIVADLDAQKSINLVSSPGSCVLKPSLKVKFATRKPKNQTDELINTGNSNNDADLFNEGWNLTPDIVEIISEDQLAKRP
jgi:hypothetical protein